MNNLQKYIQKRKKNDQDFALNFDSAYAEFKISEILKEAGLTQEEIVIKLHTTKSAISRIENYTAVK